MATMVSERYALSLYELAQEADVLDQMLQEFGQVAQIAKETDGFLPMLQAPSIALSDKKEVLSKAFAGQIHVYLLHFLMLLTEKNRIGGLLDMYAAFKERYNKDHGICEATITTAVPLSQLLAQKLQQKLEQMTGKQVVLTQQVDASIMGGAIIAIGNEQLDASVEHKLAELAQQMKQTIA